MSTNALLVSKSAAMELSASINWARTSAYARPVTVEIRTMDFAHQPKRNAYTMVTAPQTKNAYNRVNASAHHLSSWTYLMDNGAKVHAKDSHAVSMQNAHQVTHPNACAPRATKEIHF